MPLSKKENKIHKPVYATKVHRKGRLTGHSFFDRCNIILDRLYRLTYYTGAQFVRSERRFSRRLETWFNRFRDKMAARRGKHYEALKRRFKKVFRDVVLPIVNIHSHFHGYGERVRRAHSFGVKEAISEVFYICYDLLRILFRVIGHILNYAAPVAGLLLLVATINHFNGLTFALSVSYSGQNIGYISDEAVFENAEKEVKKRIVYDDQPIGASNQAAEVVKVLAGYTTTSVAARDAVKPQQITPALTTEGQQVVAMPQYTLSVVPKGQLTDEDTLTDRIIEASGSEITQASGLYIQGEFKGASSEPEEVLDTLKGMLDQYKTDNDSETIHFVNKIELKDGLYPVNSLRETQEFSAMMSGNVSGETFYTVMEGDSPSLIADKTGVPLSELNSMNSDITTDFLPGKQLLISRSVPMMKVQVTRRETYEKEIAFDTEYIDNATLPKGLEQTKKEGVKGTMEVQADVVYIDGVSISSTVVKESVVSEAVTRVIERGTNVPKPTNNSSGVVVAGNGGMFVWPVYGAKGYNSISMPIWGYWGHTGTDIQAYSGTTVVAAASGRVITATQTRYGYGRYIILDHGNGYTTLYGHNSSLLVKVGDYVQQGQAIATVGRTGNATGNHCHFEIRKGGQYLDARQFIGYRYPY